MSKINELNEKLIVVLQEKIKLLEDQKEISQKIAKIQEEQLIIADVVKQSELFECRNVSCNKMVKRNSGTVFCKKHRNL